MCNNRWDSDNLIRYYKFGMLSTVDLSSTVLKNKSCRAIISHLTLNILYFFVFQMGTV